MSISFASATPTLAPRLTVDILSHLCTTVSDQADTLTLIHLARCSGDLHDVAIPALYRHITLSENNIIPFFTPCTVSSAPSAWVYTTHLDIASIPDDLPSDIIPTTPSSSSSSPRLFPNVRSITIGSKATWQLIVHSHAHPTPHPLISFLTSQTSPEHLTVHYPTTERTAHSFGGGYCCCFAAIRAFQQNPLRAAAFDRSSTARLISGLASQWTLQSLSLRGVVDDQLPVEVGAARMEVEWAACQCADETYHGEWCFNHVSPLKRVEQVRELLGWAAERGTVVTMRGMANVGGWSDIEDVGKWINERLAEDSKEHTCCSLKVRS